MTSIKKFRYILFSLLFVILLFSISGCNKKNTINQKAIFVSDNLTATPIPDRSSPAPSQPTVLKPAKVLIQDKKELTLLAVGDNLIHIQVIESGKQADGSFNFNHLYSHLAKDIASADIAIINQETIFGGNEDPYTGYPEFNSPTEIGDAIISAGFDVVLSATNHAMDKDSSGVLNTIKYWKEHPEIKLLGINESAKAKKNITILEKNGIKVAMLNYTYGLNGHLLPDDMPYLVNILDKHELKKDIVKAKELADFVIVFPHWGTEYKYKPDDMQKEYTDFFAEQGVDLVIGTHPHVLEPIQWIMTKSGHKMLVYYSLGNYVSYQKEAPRLLGGMAMVTLRKDTYGTSISKASITPIVTHYENTKGYAFGVYELSDYTESQAKVHGVLGLEKDSLFTLKGTRTLAEQVLGDWIK